MSEDVEISGEPEKEENLEINKELNKEDLKEDRKNYKREYTPEQTEAKLKELREENKARRIAEREIRQSLAETQKKLHENELKMQERVINAEIKLAAQKYKLRNIEDAKKLADLTSVKLLDSGDVAGVEEAISSLKEQKPYLFDLGNTSIVGGSAPLKSSGSAPKSALNLSDSELKAAEREMIRKR